VSDARPARPAGLRHARSPWPLRLQRCGQECRTAKLVASWSRDDFAKSPVQAHDLAEDGEYDLWLRQELPTGEIGAAAEADYRTALREAKQRLLARLRRAGIVLDEDSEVSPTMMVCKRRPRCASSTRTTGSS